MRRSFENEGKQQMPSYEIEQYEVHAQTYRVKANSEAEALKMLFDGQADPVGNRLDYIAVCEDLGLPVEEYRELADQLHSLGVSLTERVIPSIRSIERVRDCGHALLSTVASCPVPHAITAAVSEIAAVALLTTRGE